MTCSRTSSAGGGVALVALSELECSFLAASQRRARRIRWIRRSLVVLAAAGRGAVCAVSRGDARPASPSELVTQAELEQGRPRCSTASPRRGAT